MNLNSILVEVKFQEKKVGDVIKQIAVRICKNQSFKNNTNRY